MELTTEQFQQLWSAIDKMEKAAVKVDKLFHVIVGDKELKQSGIIDEMEELKAQVAEFKKQLDVIDKLIIKTKGYIAGSLFVGSIAGSIITILVKSIFKL
jgi:hypothetical protein